MQYPYTCKQCGKPFTRIRKQNYKYCCRQCWRDAQHGKNNRRWKGGRFTSRGYVHVLAQDHPNARDTGYVKESVLVMTEHLGRALVPGEIVHHINGIRDDNRLENLVVMTRASHCSHHHKELVKPNSLKNLQPHPEGLSPMTPERGKQGWITRRRNAMGH